MAAVLLVHTVSMTPAPGAPALPTRDTSPPGEPSRIAALAGASLRPVPPPATDAPDPALPDAPAGPERATAFERRTAARPPVAFAARPPVCPAAPGEAAASPAPGEAAAPESADRAGAARPERVVRAAARPAAMWAQLRRGLTVTGRATWYGATRGYLDVAHVAMAGARYLPRGRAAPKARVCVDGRCAVLPVVDFCGCHVGSPRARIVDLSAAALRRLGLDPSRGVYRVRVSLVAS